jgi:hypothetical protein
MNLEIATIDDTADLYFTGTGFVPAAGKWVLGWRITSISTERRESSLHGRTAYWRLMSDEKACVYFRREATSAQWHVLSSSPEARSFQGIYCASPGEPLDDALTHTMIAHVKAGS